MKRLQDERSLSSRVGGGGGAVLKYTHPNEDCVVCCVIGGTPLQSQVGMSKVCPEFWNGGNRLLSDNHNKHIILKLVHKIGIPRSRRQGSMM